MRRARRTTSSAVAVRSIEDARARGLITSAAVCSPKLSDLVTSRAVPASSVPAWADRRTSEASSCGVRAPDSSSLGVMPSARRNRFAEPLSTKIRGRATSAKPRTGIATTFAVASGAEIPRNCGSSSPNTIENNVAMTRARPAATESSVEPLSPTALSGVWSSTPSDGVARKPRIRVVSVMPTWAAESWVESRRSEPSTTSARASPPSTAFCTVGRSSATSENSVATKMAVPIVNPTPVRTSNHSVIVRTS